MVAPTVLYDTTTRHRVKARSIKTCKRFELSFAKNSEAYLLAHRDAKEDFDWTERFKDKSVQR